MYVSVQAVTAVCAVIALSGAGVALYVRAALGSFLEKLDERFVACPVCYQRHSDMERRLEACEHAFGE
jgi:hypothetical protein